MKKYEDTGSCDKCLYQRSPASKCKERAFDLGWNNCWTPKYILVIEDEHPIPKELTPS